MWDQWSAGAPPMPPLSTGNVQPPLIGPVQPTATVPSSSDSATPPTGPAVIPASTYSSSPGAPSYTPAQYAAMTVEQQYAVQQHWQQWQAYEQQYAQWHAQYGEQYKREMAAIHSAPPPMIPPYGTASVQAPATNSFAYPPPAISNSYQAPPSSTHAPPPPPPDDSPNIMGIKAPPQIYEQPPPPPPPPQQEEKQESRSETYLKFQGTPSAQIGNTPALQYSQNPDNRWSQPPPLMQNQTGRWDESISQDRKQQNQFNQQFNNKNQRGKPLLNQSWEHTNRDEQGRENRQGNRQSNDFRGRTRGRNGNNFDNRQQQFDDSEVMSNRQQAWQQSDSSGQRTNRGGQSNSFDTYKNTSQSSGQQNSLGRDKSNQGNNIPSADNQRQQQIHQNQGTSVENLNNNSGSVDEKAFDEQFRLWEEQFENWKKENANHPDRTMYMQYEREFEKTRIRLLERREQMRRRKITEFQPVNPQQIGDHLAFDHKENEQIAENNQVVRSNMEQTEAEDNDSGINRKQIASTAELQDITTYKEVDGTEKNMFKNKEITELFKTADGIPGLDLVESKEEDKSENAVTGLPDSEIIDLDNDGPTRPAKVPATMTNIAGILPSVMQQSAIKDLSPDLGCHLPASIKSSQPIGRKIPSLFDIVVEKPILSPDTENQNAAPVRNSSPTGSKSSKTDVASGVVDSRSRSVSEDRDLLTSPGQRPLSQLSSMSQQQQRMQNNLERSNDQAIHQSIYNQQMQQPNNLPSQAADLAKALQDPNVMQLLTVALAQAQQAGGINQGGNSHQNQLLQQLQQLRPLLQMQQQDRNFNNEPWNHPLPQRSQLWQNQNSNTKVSADSNQNHSAWSGNPFSRNSNQLPLSRGHEGGNESDSNNDMQQRNPRNPFRRSTDRGNSGNCAENISLGGDFENESGHGAFNNANGQGVFGGPLNAQQQRGGNFGGRFDNNRPLSNFGISPGFRNNPNSFGDRSGDDNDYYRPAQVFDYQNRSRADAIVPPAKVVDYGHRPSMVMPTNYFDRDSSEFVPVKTIDYGHASNSVQNENQYQQKKTNFANKTNNWNQDQPSNKGKQTQSQGLVVQSHGEKLKSLSPILQNETRERNTQNKQQQQRNVNELTKKGNMTEDDPKKELNESEINECFDELEEDNAPQYPKNQWILLNTESRRRPGPPTKRGKRNSGRFGVRNKLDVSGYTNTEYEEIEENFEEISDNEDLNEIIDITPESTHFKAKSQPLFPSVSNSIAQPTMVFPSMENNNTIPIDEILFKPGRLTRPKNIVIIIRGPPGSGKSHVAKLIKDKEVEMCGPTPRLLSIDDYFMIENDYEEKCPKTGRKIPKKEILYEYEKEMEDTYMQYLIKSFKKTITDHLFDFIIVDCCNQSLRTFNEFYNAARDGNFSPFIVDMICDVDKCLNQNIHNRKEDEIKDIIKNYQDCPGHYIKLDVSNLLENVVEMEDVSDLEDNFAADSEVVDLDEEDEVNDNEGGGFLKSKWDTDPTTENLARLDGTSKPISKRGTATIEEYLQIDGWEPPSSTTNGKKRVRWADIEEKRAQDKMRAIGFVVGQTDWNRMMDPTSGSAALTKTKYIERLNKRR